MLFIARNMFVFVMFIKYSHKSTAQYNTLCSNFEITVDIFNCNIQSFWYTELKIMRSIIAKVWGLF